MTSRRQFLQIAGAGLFMPFMALSDNGVPSVILSQPGEGETYFVRENTPITIHISKKDNTSISICTEAIPPGGSIPLHQHLFNDEFFIFQKGNGMITAGDKEFKVTAGTIGFVPRATWHSIKNNGPSSLLFTFGYSPAGFEDFFRAIGTPKGLTFKAKTPEEIQSMAVKYGMVYRMR